MICCPAAELLSREATSAPAGYPPILPPLTLLPSGQRTAPSPIPPPDQSTAPSPIDPTRPLPIRAPPPPQQTPPDQRTAPTPIAPGFPSVTDAPTQLFSPAGTRHRPARPLPDPCITPAPPHLLAETPSPRSLRGQPAPGARLAARPGSCPLERAQSEPGGQAEGAARGRAAPPGAARLGERVPRLQPRSAGQVSNTEGKRPQLSAPGERGKGRGSSRSGSRSAPRSCVAASRLMARAGRGCPP